MWRQQVGPNLTSLGAGLGLRRGLLPEFTQLEAHDIDFFEVAPENWIRLGGRFGRQFCALAERFPVTLHGLSLNIGGAAPLDMELLSSIKAFIQRFNCPIYSEHLTACADDGQLYDLMPLPFTCDAVRHVAERVSQVQDYLGQRIYLENASYYAALSDELSEAEFVTAVCETADCGMLLDVNNVYVNSINHRYDPEGFLQAIPAERVGYVHVAGHFEEAEDLRVDTHGSDVIDPVWALLDQAYRICGVKPTLLERDFNYPPMADLLGEVDTIRCKQSAAGHEATTVKFGQR